MGLLSKHSNLEILWSNNLQENETKEFKEEIRKQAREQAAKWTIVTVGALVSVALAGWWFALKPSIVQELGGVPSGAIVAFADARYSDYNKGDPVTEGCPTGWIRFKEGEGRFVIGANTRSQNDGSGSYWVSRQAGKPTVTLDERNLPSHTHSIDIGTKQTMKFVNWDRFDGGSGNSPLVRNSGTRHPYSPGGEYSTKPNPNYISEPISILPPYIALYLCKKT